MSKQDFQQPLDSSRYRWLAQLIILMNLVAVAAGVVFFPRRENSFVFFWGGRVWGLDARNFDKR
mgnify:CR=1 FL=1